MKHPAVENITNPRLRKMAEESITRHRGDFGMTVEGGVDLEKFAQAIINECLTVVEAQRDPTNLNYKPSERTAEAIRLHFGV